MNQSQVMVSFIHFLFSSLLAAIVKSKWSIMSRNYKLCMGLLIFHSSQSYEIVISYFDHTLYSLPGLSLAWGNVLSVSLCLTIWKIIKLKNKFIENAARILIFYKQELQEFWANLFYFLFIIFLIWVFLACQVECLLFKWHLLPH